MLYNHLIDTGKDDYTPVRESVEVRKSPREGEKGKAGECSIAGVLLSNVGTKKAGVDLPARTAGPAWHWVFESLGIFGYAREQYLELFRCLVPGIWTKNAISKVDGRKESARASENEGRRAVPSEPRRVGGHCRGQALLVSVFIGTIQSAEQVPRVYSVLLMLGRTHESSVCKVTILLAE